MKLATLFGAELDFTDAEVTRLTVVEVWCVLTPLQRIQVRVLGKEGFEALTQSSLTLIAQVSYNVLFKFVLAYVGGYGFTVPAQSVPPAARQARADQFDGVVSVPPDHKVSWLKGRRLVYLQLQSSDKLT